MPDNVQITAILNPVRPHESRTDKWVDHAPSMTVLDCIREFYPLVDASFDAEVSVNGRMLDADALDGAGVAPGDQVVFCAVPKGDNPLRTVALLAVMVVAAYISGPAGAGFFGSQAAASVAGAAFAIGGGVAVNAILPPNTPDIQAIGAAAGFGSTSPTYGFEAGPNVYLEGSRWPIMYGTRRVKPPILARHITTRDAGDSVILTVDNTDATVSSTGTWSEVTDSSGYGGTYHRTLYAGSTFSLQTAVAIFGQFTVRAWWGDGNGKATYRIYDGDTLLDTITRYQTDADPAGWHDLGIYDFISTAKVVITADSIGTPVGVVADAVRFEALDDEGPSQFIHILMAVADHAVDSITNVEVNGAPIENFDGASYETRLGTLDKSPISDFLSQRSQEPVNAEISPGDGYVWTTTGNAVTSLECGLILPGGCYYAADDGSLRKTSYMWRFHYRAYGDTEWTPFAVKRVNKATRRAQRVYARVSDLAPGKYQLFIDPIEAPQNNTRYSPRESRVEYVGEIIQEDYSYPGASLLSVRARATGELSGSQPTITCLVTRSTVETADGPKPANLPPWACYDLHVNREYGERISTDKMIISEFSTWSSDCTANGFEANMYIDSKLSLVDACANFELVGRGRVIERGTKYGVVIDKPKARSQLFGTGNIVENSFRLDYIDQIEQANVVQVTYWDAENNYIRRVAQVVADGLNPATDDIVVAQIVLYACTATALALRHAKYVLNCNQLLTRSVGLQAFLNALACTIGDRADVSYAAINWGESGRVVSATTSTVTIDRKVTLTAGDTYHVVVQHQDDDSIEEATLAPVGTDTTSETVTLSGTWTKVPAADAVVSVGLVNAVTKQFTVTGITRASDQKRRLTLIEYNENVHNDTVAASVYEPPAVEPRVAGLAAMELMELAGGNYRIGISLTWRGSASYWDVYYRISGTTAWIYAGSTAEPDYQIDNLSAGETYDFAVTVPGEGISSGQTIAGFQVTGWADTSLPVWRVSGLEIAKNGNGSNWYGRDLETAWNAVAEYWPETAGDEPGGVGTSPAPETPITYRVVISNPDGSVRREVSDVKENAFRYTWEMNYQDGNGTPSSALSVSIWARNAAGQESAYPATLYVTNPAPSDPTGVQALAHMGGAKCMWNKSIDPDPGGYQVRWHADTDAWTPDWTGIEWQDCDGTEFVANLTNLQRISDYTTIYFQVRAVDTFGSVSGAVGADATVNDFYVVESDLAAALATKINANEDMASAVELLRNQWTLKIQENGYATGMGAILHYEWSPTETYDANDYVAISSGAVYKSLQASNTGHEPSASPTWWELVPYGARSEIIFLTDKFSIINTTSGDGVARAPFIVGNINGVSTTGINGALMVDGTITGVAVNTNTLTAAHIKGSAFGSLTITSGDIDIQAANGLSISSGGSFTVDTGSGIDVLSGGDLSLYKTAGDTSYLTFFYGTSTRIIDLYLSAADNFVIEPYANLAYNLNLGTASKNFASIFARANTINLYAASKTYVNGDLTFVDGDIQINSGGSRHVFWSGAALTAALSQSSGSTHFSPLVSYANMYFGESGNNWQLFYVYADTPAVTGSWGSLSDLAEKENVVAIADPMVGKLVQLPVIKFSYTGKDEVQVGFPAQDVRALFPAAVRELTGFGGQDNPDPLAIVYDRITALNTKCIQEQQDMIDALTARIETLEGERYGRAA